MYSVIEKTKNGFTISFQTRGVDMKTATEIWKEGYCAEIHKTDLGNYTIWCGKTYNDVEKD